MVAQRRRLDALDRRQPLKPRLGDLAERRRGAARTPLDLAQLELDGAHQRLRGHVRRARIEVSDLGASWTLGPRAVGGLVHPRGADAALELAAPAPGLEWRHATSQHAPAAAPRTERWRTGAASAMRLQRTSQLARCHIGGHIGGQPLRANIGGQIGGQTRPYEPQIRPFWVRRTPHECSAWPPSHGLSRRRSRVRVPSLPLPGRPAPAGGSCETGGLAAPSTRRVPAPASAPLPAGRRDAR